MGVGFVVDDDYLLVLIMEALVDSIKLFSGIPEGVVRFGMREIISMVKNEIDGFVTSVENIFCEPWMKDR